MPHPMRGWAVRHTFTHKAPVTAITATDDGYVTGDRDGVVVCWNTKTGQRRETLLDGTNASAKNISALCLSPDRKRLNVIADNCAGQIELAGTERTFYGPDHLWSVVTVCADGIWLGAPRFPEYGNRRALRLLSMGFASDRYWSRTLGSELAHPADPRRAAGVPGFIVSADADHTVRGWALNKDGVIIGEPWSVSLKQLAPGALALSPDGTLVAVAGASGTVAVLSARRGETVATLMGHTGAVRSVVFAPDSGLIATGGADGTVRLWNPWTGEPEGELQGHTEPVNAVWFASDEVLMSASADKTARVWTYLP
jgi:WD40 repeat protein